MRTITGHKIDLPPRKRGLGKRRVFVGIAPDDTLFLKVETIGGRWPQCRRMRVSFEAFAALVACANAAAEGYKARKVTP